MARNIRDNLVEKRRARVAALGHAEGVGLPEKREAPLIPFLGANGLICEVKRRSPSRGDIAPGRDAAAQAATFAGAGATNISVLTEPEGFGGGLADLLAIKRAFPGLSLLRKDFLFDPEDIEVSWRAGADAVLLIAGMLAGGRLAELHRLTLALGMRALVEVHDRDDLGKAAAFSPDLVGVNSRDLSSFRIDPLLPAVVASGIDWPATLVYESGLWRGEQADFAAACGFGGILVGEAVMRRPELVGRFLSALGNKRRDRFWPAVGHRLFRRRGPLVKICGLTRADDARLAAGLGADALGFVFCPGSPRRARPDLLRDVRELEALKIGVVMVPSGSRSLPPEVGDLLADGWLDAVQFHGEEPPDACREMWPAYYKALKPSGVGDLRVAEDYFCPRLLLDAAGSGGTGKRVPEGVLDAWHRPLWLAGGIGPDNASGIAAGRKPELIDVASGVESAPGIKDRSKLERLFKSLGV
ncbi:MAG: bifunctional indole-3-glycerol phosphate synthase/phosphoribosylanthranilate isomerase [Planctomycetota bacterium]|jgi:indole-3-glycerol phosphate synthase/phosphoribosylanthranilate isomerase|nr:bifunctional indole-3-glycerol phosphate synthase/phosphoribosylanthranilate isomerase [Planctomycetota bacterium]